jgi:hypothetical protein
VSSIDTHGEEMEGLWFEKFGHKNAINHEKGDPLDFLITPSTPLKRIRPPGIFPSTKHLWCQWILISVEYARFVDSRFRGPAAKPPQLSRAKRICSTSLEEGASRLCVVHEARVVLGVL